MQTSYRINSWMEEDLVVRKHEIIWCRWPSYLQMRCSIMLCQTFFLSYLTIHIKKASNNSRMTLWLILSGAYVDFVHLLSCHVCLPFSVSLCQLSPAFLILFNHVNVLHLLCICPLPLRYVNLHPSFLCQIVLDCSGVPAALAGSDLLVFDLCEFWMRVGELMSWRFKLENFNSFFFNWTNTFRVFTKN